MLELVIHGLESKYLMNVIGVTADHSFNNLKQDSLLVQQLLTNLLKFDKWCPVQPDDLMMAKEFMEVLQLNIQKGLWESQISTYDY